MSNIGFAWFHRTSRCRTYVWGGAIKIGARPSWGGVGDFKCEHWLPEITYPTFNMTSCASKYTLDGNIVYYDRVFNLINYILNSLTCSSVGDSSTGNQLKACIEVMLHFSVL